MVGRGSAPLLLRSAIDVDLVFPRFLSPLFELSFRYGGPAGRWLGWRACLLIPTPQRRMDSCPALLPPRGGSLSAHALRARGLNNDFPFALSIKEAKQKHQGKPMLSNKVQLFVSPKKRKRIQRLRGEQVEVYVYMDGEFQSEVPIDTIPASIDFDTSKYTNGDHILTINLRTSQGRCGSSTMKINIQN